MKIGSKVNVLGNGDLSGLVVGKGSATRKGSGKATKYCLVELDEGFWSQDRNVFVSILIVHPTSLEAAN